MERENAELKASQKAIGTPLITTTNLPLIPETLYDTIDRRLKQSESDLASLKLRLLKNEQQGNTDMEWVCDKLLSLESGFSTSKIWQIPNVSIVMNHAKGIPDPRSEHHPTTPADCLCLISPVFKTGVCGYNFQLRFYPYGCDTAAGNSASLNF